MDKEIKEEDRADLDRMSMFSSPKMGRPKIWTDEAIDAFAAELVEWAKQKTSIVLASFVADKAMNPDILSKLAHLSTNFNEALIISKRLVGARRETGTLLKKFEPKTYSMSQRMYDPDWSKHMDEQLAREELIKAQAKIKAMKSELKNQGEIIKYLESQKVIDTITK